MKDSPSGSWKRHVACLAVALFLPLAILFQASLDPAMVLFSNDGPLGTLVSQADNVLHTFTGLWRPLNWVGNQDPSSQPDLTMALFIALRSPILFAKFYAPLALLLLGLSAWFFCRCAGFNPLVGVLTASAAALNSNPVSYACWGLPPKALALAATLCALGLLLKTSFAGWKGWLRVVLAGFCVGINVVEGADVGAILSLYVAAFAAWQIWIESSAGVGLGVWIRGGARLALVAVCAAWIAAHALASLVGTQIKGISGLDSSPESKAERWEFATGWSYPKLETLRILIPGLFGYRMDTPGGGAYWGGVGQDGTPQSRFSGSGEYAGALVLVIAGLACVRSFRGRASGAGPYTHTEQRVIWFWMLAALVSLALAYGRFAPFYQYIFQLPYFSTIRIPMKFLHGMHLSLWILFAYGLEGIARTGFDTTTARKGSFLEQIREWLRKAPASDRAWWTLSLVVLGISVIGAVLYASRAPQIEQYLGTIQFGESERATAAFSVGEVWTALFFLIASVAVVVASLSGWFAGTRSKVAWYLLGFVLVFDLFRADRPWIKHYDYQIRYQSNAVIDLLRERPWEGRVTAHLSPRRAGVLAPNNEFSYLQKEWLEHPFQYFNIQSLDIDQMPRTPEMEAAFFSAMGVSPEDDASRNKLSMLVLAATYGPLAESLPPQTAAQLPAAREVSREAGLSLVRMWQLTNTRYFIGWRKSADIFNDLFDPAQRRFTNRIVFDLAFKPGVPPPPKNMPFADVISRVTTQPNPQGAFALFEFSGALPRARLFNQWSVQADGTKTLEALRSRSFDPETSVILSEAPSIKASASSGTVGSSKITTYEPRRVVVQTESKSAGILLLNDRWTPDWKVTIDGKPAPLLRANFLMRAVAVSEGSHAVEFRFEPPAGTLWISVAALAAAAACIGILVVSGRRDTAASDSKR